MFLSSSDISSQQPWSRFGFRKEWEMDLWCWVTYCPPNEALCRGWCVPSNLNLGRPWGSRAECAYVRLAKLGVFYTFIYFIPYKWLNWIQSMKSRLNDLGRDGCCNTDVFLKVVLLCREINKTMGPKISGPVFSLLSWIHSHKLFPLGDACIFYETISCIELYAYQSRNRSQFWGQFPSHFNQRFNQLNTHTHTHKQLIDFNSIFYKNRK